MPPPTLPFIPRSQFAYDRKLFWRPGHQYKALKSLERGIGNIDLVVQVRDARVPLSSSSPSIHKALGRRDSLTVFNKADLANSNMQKVYACFIYVMLEADNRSMD